MSPRDRTLLSVVGALAIIAAAWFLVISPKRQESHKVQGQIDAVQQTLDQASSQLSQEISARDALRRDANALLNVTRAVPHRIAMPTLLRGLEITAARMGVQMTSLTTSGTSAATTTTTPDPTSTLPAGVQSVSLSLTFAGSFPQLQHLLAKVQNFVRVSRQRVAASGRLLSISSVDLTPDSTTPGSVQAQVQGTIYILQPTAAATGTGSTTGTPAAPAAPPASGASPTPAATEVAP